VEDTKLQAPYVAGAPGCQCQGAGNYSLHCVPILVVICCCVVVIVVIVVLFVVVVLLLLLFPVKSEHQN
jgi:hypothetical protein